jgi:transcription termination factor NusB
MKVADSHLEGFGTIKYCRGVNFVATVLPNAESILELIPSFVNDKSISQLKTIDDAILLGQYMVLCEVIDKL